MQIETMSDLKQALNQIPDNVLEHYGFAQWDGGIGLATSKGEDETEFAKNIEKDKKVYPEMVILEKYFDNIAKEASGKSEKEYECFVNTEE